jgi:hypothetical protein
LGEVMQDELATKADVRPFPKTLLGAGQRDWRPARLAPRSPGSEVKALSARMSTAFISLAIACPEAARCRRQVRPCLCRLFPAPIVTVN